MSSRRDEPRHNRVTQLARAASKGWITDQEAEVLIGELQARIREANNFYPRSTYIRPLASELTDHEGGHIHADLPSVAVSRFESHVHTDITTN